MFLRPRRRVEKEVGDKGGIGRQVVVTQANPKKRRKRKRILNGELDYRLNLVNMMDRKDAEGIKKRELGRQTQDGEYGGKTGEVMRKGG